MGCLFGALAPKKFEAPFFGAQAPEYWASKLAQMANLRLKWGCGTRERPAEQEDARAAK